MAPVPVASYQRPYFYFDACSQALTARFTRPSDYHIDAQASSSLCASGGESRARVVDFGYRNLISFDAGHTHISAGYEENETSNNTLAAATVEGLNILNVVTADLVVAHTYSKYPKDAPEGRVSMNGCEFKNLRICGQPVQIELNFALFEGIKTFKEAQDAYLQNGEFWEIARDPFQTGQDLPPQKDTGAFLCSLIKRDIQVDCPGVRTAGHAVFIPDFGTVYLAEMMISRGQRTFSMIRFNLDCAVGATGSVASGTTNGKQWPPTG